MRPFAGRVPFPPSPATPPICRWSSKPMAPGAHLLDLGCGPGCDAESLARKGFRVTGIDWSGAMVEEARSRVVRSALGDRVEVAQLGIQELDRLPAFGFDAAYSNFGPLNCV